VKLIKKKKRTKTKPTLEEGYSTRREGNTPSRIHKVFLITEKKKTTKSSNHYAG